VVDGRLPSSRPFHFPGSLSLVDYREDMKRALVIVVLALTPGSAVAAGRASLNVYFQSNLKNTGYQNRTFEKVVRAWKAPAASQTPEVGRKSVVQAVLAKDGKLISATVSMSSGKKGWDAAALAAVRSAAPFDPLPEGFAAPSVEVHFHVSVVP
jgi:protein TonB